MVWRLVQVKLLGEKFKGSCEWKMRLKIQTSLIVLLCCLLEGFYGLRMIKVSIPAYKLRGESAFLECQYELERRKSQGLQEGYQDTTGTNRGDINYSDGNSQDEELHPHTFTQSYAYPHENSQELHYQRKHSGQYKHFRNNKRSTYYQSQQYHQHNNRAQQDEDDWPYRTPPSPYGHSIYRGRSSSSMPSPVSSYAVSYGLQTRFVDRMPHSREHGDSFIKEESREKEAEVQDEIEDDEFEELYAIKWYKDNEEFYRYVPKVIPPKTSYKVNGVRVVEEHSDSSRVLLRGLTINATGLYRCEVSGEAPNFSSVVGEGQMDVVYLPRDGPHIKGQRFQYQIGETLNLNCTSGKSHPASYLQWYINDKPIIDKRLLINYNNTVHRHGLITAKLGLSLVVEANDFENGAMRVKCVASISPILWKGGKESILQRRPGIIDNREAMLLVHGASSSIHVDSFRLCYLMTATLAFLVKISQL